jgi:2-iminoacetate synthase
MIEPLATPLRLEGTMSFHATFSKYKDIDLPALFNTLTRADIRRILAKTTIDEIDFLSLLSPAAEPFLETMAQKAHRLTVQHFGRTILLFTPLYLSNYCTNQCRYCGFNTRHRIARKQLSFEEVEKEARTIAATGLKHILVLTGDAPQKATRDYLKTCTRILATCFSSIGIEIYALDTPGYRELVSAGVDSLTLYQETYNPARYDELHVRGPKKNFRFRLEAPDAACRAGIRSVSVGALLGLDEYRRESFFTGLHAHYLQNQYPEVEIAVALPRMRSHAGEFQPPHPVSDRNLVQSLVALRLFLPRIGITLSTREAAGFRDNLLQLGVTKMSAGSTTVVGGHTGNDTDTGQFDICDHRSVAEMKQCLQQLGYQPVFKNWHPLSAACQPEAR